MHWPTHVHAENLRPDRQKGFEAGHCVQVVTGKRPTVDLVLRGASAAGAPEDEDVAPDALLCGLVTDVSGARSVYWQYCMAEAQPSADL